MDDPLLQNADRAESKRGELYFHWIWATYHFGKNEFSEALAHADDMIAVLESQPHRLRDDCTLYVLSLGNSLALHRRCGDYDGFTSTMQKLDQFRADFESIKHLRSPRVASSLFQTSVLYKLAFHNSYAEFDECVAMAPDVDAGIAEYGEYINPHILHKFYGNLCYAHFALGNVRTAVDYNNRILCDDLPDEGRQSYFAAHLVRLVLHFEMGHTQLLEYLIPSTERYLRKQETWGRLEEAVVGFFRNAMHAVDRDEFRQLCAGLHDQIEEISEDPLTQNGLRYFGYDRWLKSKITGKSMAELEREAVEEMHALVGS
jgi:hypothetical protein